MEVRVFSSAPSYIQQDLRDTISPILFHISLKTKRSVTAEATTLPRLYTFLRIAFSPYHAEYRRKHERSRLFKSLESIYYFRMRIPTDLQPIFKRTELKKSLRTRSKTVAQRRCRQYVAAAEQIFESLRLSHFKAELIGTNPTRALDLTGTEQNNSHCCSRNREQELWDKVFKAADSAASYNDTSHA